METKIMLTCTNQCRPDYGKQYKFSSVFEYALNERKSYDQSTSEILDKEVMLSDSQIQEVVECAYKLDLKEICFDDFDIGNKWKDQSVIDFDNPIVDEEDVALSFYIAISEAWIRIACQ